LRSLAEEKLELQRMMSAEQAQLTRSELASRHDRLQAAVETARAHFETGLETAANVEEIEAQLAQARTSLARFDLETKAHAELAVLERQQELLQQNYQRLMADYQRAAQTRADAAAEPAAGENNVIVATFGALRASLVPRSEPYTEGGPAVWFPVADSAGASTPDGRRISRIRFAGWREAGAIRVMVLVSVPRDDQPNTYTTDSSRLVERDAGTYLVRSGQMVELTDLDALGISNVWLSGWSWSCRPIGPAASACQPAGS
jgi:hypothetical protein